MSDTVYCLRMEKGTEKALSLFATEQLALDASKAVVEAMKERMSIADVSFLKTAGSFMQVIPEQGSTMYFYLNVTKVYSDLQSFLEE